ncbi:hypothetical protein LEMLEM_LOCUS10244 [Lemmus lemmus]
MAEPCSGNIIRTTELLSWVRSLLTFGHTQPSLTSLTLPQQQRVCRCGGEDRQRLRDIKSFA